tara:strand:+ start:2031 stop:2855 length:825 start_codon:yes stop_codon:yes gene_type:complete
MPNISVRETSLSYQEVGDGLHVVVLIHGNHQSSQIWSPVLTKMPEEFRALAFDLRGFGSSEKRADGADIHGHADDIRQALHKLSVVRCSVMASAAGCGVAISLAARYPSLIYKLVMSGPFSFNQIGASIQEYQKDCGLQSTAEEVSLHPISSTPLATGWNLDELLPIVMKDLAREPNPEQKDALISIAMNCHRGASANWSRSMAWPVLSQLLPEITAKTRVVKGPDDLSHDYPDKLKFMIDDCDIAETPKPTLCPVLECPDDYLESALELLNAW